MDYIAVIDPAVRVPELDCFNRISAASSLTTTYHLPGLFGPASLEADHGELAGIIILGSSSSVHDGLAWHHELSSWLRPRIDAAIPTLGICFGHQLIAHLYGGGVGYCFPDKRKLQGFRTLELSTSRLWGAAGKGDAFVSHREAVTTCPPGFRVMISSPEVPIEGLEHSTLPVWTLQSHPEATPAFLKNVGFSQKVDDACFSFGHGLVRKFLECAAKKA